MKVIVIMVVTIFLMSWLASYSIPLALVLGCTALIYALNDSFN